MKLGPIKEAIDMTAGNYRNPFTARVTWGVNHHSNNLEIISKHIA